MDTFFWRGGGGRRANIYFNLVLGRWEKIDIDLFSHVYLKLAK